jgi:hypothetical protein
MILVGVFMDVHCSPPSAVTAYIGNQDRHLACHGVRLYS